MQYFYMYLGIGAFLVAVALLHKVFDREHVFIASVVMFLAWPLILLFAPDAIMGTRNNEYIEKVIQKDHLKEKTIEFLNSEEKPSLSEEEIKRITRVAKYGYGEVSTFSNTANFKDIIHKLWSINLHPELYYSYLNSVHHLDENYYPEFEPRFSLKTPDWYVGFSNEFVKSITKIDKKKQGRILEAISKISLAPTELTGNTIKPLTGDLSGLWRCRLGNDRLIYFPDIKSRKIVLIAFASRGGVYGELPDVTALTNKD